MGRAAAPAIADIVKAHSDEMERCLAARAAQATRAPSQRQAAPGAASLPGGIELRRSGLSSLVWAMEVDSEPAGASSASLPSPPSSSPPLPRRASSLKRTCSHLSVDATPFYPRGEPAAARDASPPLSLTAEEQEWLDRQVAIQQQQTEAGDKEDAERDAEREALRLFDQDERNRAAPSDACEYACTPPYGSPGLWGV